MKERRKGRERGEERGKEKERERRKRQRDREREREEDERRREGRYSLGGKNPPARQQTPVQFLDGEDPLEKGKATHSSILAWRIPWTV